MSYEMDEGSEAVDFNPDDVKVDLPPEHVEYELCIQAFRTMRSSAGHAMLVLDVRGTQEARAEGTIFLPYSAKTLWKFRAVLGAIGVEEKRGYAASEFVGKLLGAKLKHGEYKGSPQCDFYDFVPPKGGPGARAFEYEEPAQARATGTDDDIPF